MRALRAGQEQGLTSSCCRAKDRGNLGAANVCTCRDECVQRPPMGYCLPACSSTSFLRARHAHALGCERGEHAR